MTFFVSVNGAARQRIDVPFAMAKRNSIGSVSTDLDLKQGDNRIVFDNPTSQEEDVRLSYIKMASALNRSGRQVMFSTSGASRPWLWAQPVAHLWRTSGDINNQWDTSIISTLGRHTETIRFAEPGFWPDPDMLEVGATARPRRDNRPGMNITEQRSQFSLWAIMNAPLFISADLRNINPDSLKILLNHDVIAVNQDPLGVAGKCVRDDGQTQVLAKRVIDGQAVALLNRSTDPAQMRFTATELGLSKGAVDVRDLWTGQSRTVADGIVTSRVEGHGVTLLRLREDKALDPTRG
jgi:alpha-galactosidase